MLRHFEQYSLTLFTITLREHWPIMAQTHKSRPHGNGEITLAQRFAQRTCCPGFVRKPYSMPLYIEPDCNELSSRE